MTTELIQRFSSDHGISETQAMIVISELLGKEKSSTAMEPSKDMIPGFSIDDLEWK